MTNNKPTIFEYAGGAPAFQNLANAFYARVKADPELQQRFRSYIEYGADIALRVSEFDQPPTTAGAIPKWDWEPASAPEL